MKDFRNLKVWQKAHSFTIKLYEITNTFPREELYGITNQLRRAVSSIPINISEGCGRFTDKDLARFLQISMGSASETKYLLLLSNNLGYLDNKDYSQSTKQIQEIKKMLAKFIIRLRNNS
ncbi:MAG: four helix bundle protein [Candidatus Dojkabacteria bacterium]|nr:four helix bundle protein [Candidatus Dojkabacteria bacterium]